MNKTFILIALAGIFVMFGVSGVVAQTQDVTGDLSEVIACSILPTTLDFGEIPFGPAIEDSGPTVTVDTAGSTTESGTVDVDVAITTDTDDLPGFYKSLLMFDVVGDGSGYTLVDLLLTQTIVEGLSKDFPTKLMGNSAIFTPGSKTATITYTCMGTPPEPIDE